MDNKRVGRQVLCFLMAGLFIFVSSPLWAKEIPVTISADEVEYLEGGQVVIAKGNVDIRGEDIRLTAQKVTFWIKREELLAERDVVLYGEEDVIRGKKMKYDFKNKKGEFVDARTYYEPWFASGKKIERISEKDIKIEQGSITTCDLDKPHYRITAKKIEIYLKEKKVIARHCFFIVGKLPLMYIPYYKRSFEDKRTRVTIVPGHSTDWGTYALGSYNFDLTKVIYGTAHLDFREKKGWGEGIDLKYEPAGRRGFWQTYYMNEKDKDTEEKKNRWRAEVSHREELKENIVGTLEVHRMSDINFRKDYFYDDYIGESNPESYFSLTGTYPRWTWNALVRKRINKFYSVTERLPELRLDLGNRKIWTTPLYYEGHYYASNLNKKTTDISTGPDKAVRVDAYNRVSCPVKLFQWLNLNPALGIRETWYSKDINGDDALRSVFSSELEASTRIFKLFNIKNERFEINRLRHLIIPRVKYEYRNKPTVLPEELINFDSIDTVDKLSFVHLGLENKLQTKRRIDGRMQNVDLISFKLESGFNVKKPVDGKRWNNIKAALELRPKSWLSFNLDSYIDTYDDKLEMINSDFTLNGRDDIWSVCLGNRYVSEGSKDLYAGLKWKLSPKWTIDFYNRYDFKDEKFEEHRYRLYRDLHCWMSSFSYVRRREQTECWLMLWIKAFPELPLSFSHAVSENS